LVPAEELFAKGGSLARHRKLLRVAASAIPESLEAIGCRAPAADWDRLLRCGQHFRPPTMESPGEALRSPGDRGISYRPNRADSVTDSRIGDGVFADVEPTSRRANQLASIQLCRIRTAAIRSMTSPRRLMDISVSRRIRLACAEVNRSSQRWTGN